MLKNTQTLALLILLSLTLLACDSDSMQANAKSDPAQPQPQAGGYSNIGNTYLKGLVDQGATVIDIRRKEEWLQTGIVEGSKTITFFDKNGQLNPNFLPQFMAETNPGEPVVLICRTGNRTVAASRAIAEQLGYSQVMNVTNGITHWIKEGNPVQKYTQ